MPSFTFVSTANAFVLRGASPVFVDIRPDTFNIDERLIEAAITARTKAIVVVHYAGVACEMDEIIDDRRSARTRRHRGQRPRPRRHVPGRSLGTIGAIATLSFHETKNIQCGEGGALLDQRSEVSIERAEIIREKGTNRSRFFRGQVDKYTWVDSGRATCRPTCSAAFLRPARGVRRDPGAADGDLEPYPTTSADWASIGWVLLSQSARS